MLNAETLAKLQMSRSNRRRIEPLYLQDEILKSGVKKFFSPFFLRQKKSRQLYEDRTKPYQ